MTYIPNCRPKMEKEAGSCFKRKDDIPDNKINPYWYGILQGNDEEFIRGYDWCIEYVVNNLFDNLDIYASDLEQIGIDVGEIDRDIVDGTNDDFNYTFNKDYVDKRKPSKWFFEYSEEELNEMNSATKLMLLIKYMINRHVETERDMLVCSMIENLKEEEYEKRYSKIQMEYDASTKVKE